MIKSRISKIIVTFLVAIIFCGTALACGEPVTPVTLTGIEVTTPPTKTSYMAGKPFDVAGMVVSAIYSDETTKVITDYNYTPSGALTVGTTKIVITFEGMSVSQDITVTERAITALTVTTPPTKTAYSEGEAFDRTGMVITASFNDGINLAVTDYILTPSNALTPDVEEVTITYLGKTATQAISVEAKVLTSIEITSQPTKKIYVIGQKFDTSGMVVKANFNDGTNAAIIGYTVSPSGALAKTDTSITITYKEQTAAVSIEIIDRALASIAVTTMPTKTFYLIGEPFAKDGMVVTGTFNDDSTEVIADFEVDTTTPLVADGGTITVTYGEGFSTTLKVTVSKEINTIVVSSPPTKIDYIAGQTFEPAGMEVTVNYVDATSEKVTAFTYAPTGVLAVTNTEITVTYGGKSASTPITVVAVSVASLAITTAPIKTKYIEGQVFDTEGMVITATYNNGTTKVIPAKTDKVVDGYTVTPAAELAKTDEKVTITYNTKTIEQPIVVRGGFSVEAEYASFDSKTAEFKTDNRDSASGKVYLGGLKVGNKVNFEFTASGAGTASIVLRAASAYMLPGKVEGWQPTEMGDTQLNKVANILVNGNAVTIPDETVMKGGKSKIKDEDGNLKGDVNLWCNWSEMFFENVPVVEGPNILVLEFKASGIKNHWDDELTGNIDTVKVLFDGEITGDSAGAFAKARAVGGGKEGAPIYTSTRTKTAYEFESFEMQKNDKNENRWVVKEDDSASGKKFIDGPKNEAVFKFKVTSLEKEDNATIDLVAAGVGDWVNGNTNMKDISTKFSVRINGVYVDLTGIKELLCRHGDDWTNWTSIVIDGVTLNVGDNEIEIRCIDKFPNFDVVNVYTGT